MSIVRVAVPVLRGKRRFHLLKGRPWSPVEHLILQALVNSPRTATTLATLSNLPKRLIVEALIRLMRAGWVEVDQQQSGTVFRATTDGSTKSQFDELPNIPKPITRWVTFVIDRVTGMTFRGRELPIFEKHIIEQRNDIESIVWLQPSQETFWEEPRAVMAALLEEDETINDVDLTGDRLVDRFALIPVRNGKVEGLPNTAVDLENAIIDAAKKAEALPPSSNPIVVSPEIKPKRRDDYLPSIHKINFQSDDLILGGPAHLQVFENILKRARDRVVIHSTFASDDSLKIILPKIIDAAHRGVRVDILWGEGEDKPEGAKTKKVLAEAANFLKNKSLDGMVSIHPFSTNSHAKILLADDGRTGKFVAVLGSCNWLYSNFESFEASVRLRDPAIVAEVSDILADLSCGSNGLWKTLSISLAALARTIRSFPPIAPARIEASLVLGAQHGHFVRRARDEAKKRIFLTSHRLGIAAKRAVIVPAIAAARDQRGVVSQVFFGQPSGKMTGVDTANLTLEANKDGVSIRSTQDPRLHAKILAWDDDFAVVSSQNWLSSDPSHSSPLQEVGVYLNGTRIADTIITTFLNARRS